MIHKKIKKLITSIIVIALIFTGSLFLYHKFPSNPFLHKNKSIEYKMDLTNFKIKQILATNKLQSLEITFSTTLNDSRYDTTNYAWLNKVSKLLTTKKLSIESNYKALFTYDLSNAIFVDNKNNTYTIMLNTNDIEVNLSQVRDLKTKENESLIGRYYSSEEVTKITTQMQELAKQKINTTDNQSKALLNTKDDLVKLFNNVGLDTNKINIVIQ